VLIVILPFCGSRRLVFGWSAFGSAFASALAMVLSR
jgi:hypothetical protein